MCLWNATNGYHYTTFLERGDRFSNPTPIFSPDGQMLATANGRNGFFVQLWDVTNKVHKADIYERSYALAFTPDGQTLAAGSTDISLWDVNSSTVKTTLSGYADGIRSLAFSPDGRILVSGSNGGVIRFWDVETATQKTVRTAHTDRINDVAFTPDGSILASASDDATVLLWDLPLLIETGAEGTQLADVMNPRHLFAEPMPMETAHPCELSESVQSGDMDTVSIGKTRRSHSPHLYDGWHSGSHACDWTSACR